MRRFFKWLAVLALIVLVLWLLAKLDVIRFDIEIFPKSTAQQKCMNQCMKVRAQECAKVCTEDKLAVMSQDEMTPRPAAKANQVSPVRKPVVKPTLHEPAKPKEKKKPRKLEKKPDSAPQQNERSMLAKASTPKENFEAWSSDKLTRDFSEERSAQPEDDSSDAQQFAIASEPPRVKTENEMKCISRLSKQLPSVNPLRIEDFCACVADRLVQKMPYVATERQFNDAMNAYAGVCYGMRLNKADATEDKKFFLACTHDRGRMFPAYKKTNPYRRAGFCSCFSDSVSSRDRDPGMKPTIEEDKVLWSFSYSHCAESYPP